MTQAGLFRVAGSQRHFEDWGEPDSARLPADINSYLLASDRVHQIGGLPLRW
jgi:hypothetical protein